MPFFANVIKLLLLEICLSQAYEYGYHPIAEEFDNLLRDTRRMWTHDLIANERRRAWHVPVSQRRSDHFGKSVVNSPVGEYFVPRYKYGNEKPSYESILNLKWPGSTEKIYRKPQYSNVDQTGAASSPMKQSVAQQNIGSSFDFTMFSGETSESGSKNEDTSPMSVYDQELPKPPISPVSETPSWPGHESESVFNHDIKTNKVNHLNLSNSAFNSQATVIEINADSNERAHENNPEMWPNKLPFNNINNNKSDAQFPIFFTNPATGIVYAITEIGRVDQNLTKSDFHKKNNNATIPIYITKQQYDRDIFLLKQQHEAQCASRPVETSNTPNKMSAISGSLATTHRPQIIRLQKPTSNDLTISKLPPIAKQPLNLQNKHPPPVMVHTDETVNDQIKLPPPRRTHNIKKKRKNKKKQRPGNKSAPVVNSQSLNNIKESSPRIVMGLRTTTSKPGINKQKISSQMERPNVPATSTTVFSKVPIAATKGSVLPPQQMPSPHLNHRPRRSLSSENVTDILKAQKSQPVTASALTKMASDGVVSIRRLHIRKKSLPKLVANATNLTFRASNKTIQFVRKHRMSTTIKPSNHNNPLAVTYSPIEKKEAVITPQSVLLSTTTKSNQNKLHKKNKNMSTSNKNRSKNKTTKRDKDDDSGIDIFDLFDYNDDDDNDDDENNSAIINDKADDDDYYYYDDDVKNVTKKPKRKIIKIDALESIEDHNSDEESGDDLKEQITHDNSSSAEDGADFGALEELDLPTEEQQEATPYLNEENSSETKNSYGNKRIRRRPASVSTENYSDDSTEDDGGGGVGSFFRMIFYPVEVVMTRVFDSFAPADDFDASDEVIDSANYPTYTQYSSAHKVDDDVEEDDSQSSSLSNWFSSLLGFNRKTKNIGSTTAAPLVTTPEPTENSGWFESWFGGSKTTSTETSASSEDYDDYDKWFSSWFNTKPKARRRTSTTSTTTTSATFPQVPILTIVDPMKNPQNWLGILAHHIINSTTTTTHNPIIDALTRTTTTENPDTPQFVSYNKYQIWRLKPQDEAQVKALNDYKKTDEGAKLQWLKGPSLRGLTDVLVSPKMIIDFQGTLQFESIAHEILIFDVGKAIAYEQNKEQLYYTTPRPSKTQQKQKYTPLINMSWNKYYDYDDIVKYLESVRMRHPQIVELFHIGRSYEGRPLIVAKLEMKNIGRAPYSNTQSSHKKLRQKKTVRPNAIFIEAGTHGLEWIGPASATWMINEILRIMKSNKTSPEFELIRKTTWYIIPVLNPDGYDYSHTYDRFWRKSRSRHISRPNGILDSAMTWLQQKKATEKVCYGVDLDRNWHYQWSKRGSSKTPCNEHYAGPTPFSEPETKALSEFLMDNRKQIKLFISMQAYGQIISYPTKANITFDTERSDDFMDVAMVGIDGLRKKGSKSRYKIDNSNDLVEQRAGCSDAFAAFEVGTPFGYTLHLADNGVHGYLLPSSSIEQAARDALEIITAMLDYI